MIDIEKINAKLLKIAETIFKTDEKLIWKPIKHDSAYKEYIEEIKPIIFPLYDALNVALDALVFYTQSNQDIKEIKHESDYAFYPNHDVALYAIKQISEILTRGGE